MARGEKYVPVNQVGDDRRELKKMYDPWGTDEVAVEEEDELVDEEEDELIEGEKIE